MTPTHARADDIVRIAASCVGWPFRHQGRDERGIDCVGLLLYVGEAIGVHLDAPANYEPKATPTSLFDAIADAGCVLRNPSEGWQNGDALVFAYDGNPQHLGIASPRGVIHAIGVHPKRVCNQIIDEKLSRRIVSTFRFPE